MSLHIRPYEAMPIFISKKINGFVSKTQNRVGCPYKKNGHIHNGKQNHQCHDCGRQFVQCCEQYLIAEEKRGLTERLLVERISLRGICREETTQWHERQS